MKTQMRKTYTVGKSLTALLMAGALFSGMASAKADCVSNQPHISDAWCAAVDCAPVYVDGGYCLLVHEEMTDPIDEAPIIENEPEYVDNGPAIHGPLNAEDGEGSVVDSEAEGECVSDQPHISDGWCKATGCSPAYVHSGHCVVINEDGEAMEGTYYP